MKPHTSRTRKIIKVLLLGGLGAVLFFLFGGCTMLMPEALRQSAKHAKDFAESNPDAFGKTNGIYFAETGVPAEPKATKPMLFLVHGSPGDWAGWSVFLADPELTSRCHVIAPDRPGYGNSSPGVAFTNLATHTEALLSLIADQSGPKIWVGHSFGSPIVVRAAIDHPDQVDAAVLIASGVDPDYEQLKWYHKLGNIGLARMVLPNGIDVANQECFLFLDELETMRSRSEWGQVTCPTWVMHGKKDGLADFREAEFAMAQLVNAPATLVAWEDAGHLLIWENYERVRAVLLEVIDSVAAPN